MLTATHRLTDARTRTRTHSHARALTATHSGDPIVKPLAVLMLLLAGLSVVASFTKQSNVNASLLAGNIFGYFMLNERADTKLSGEVDRVTRRLAEGALDDLAIKSRYLEYRYGGAAALEDMTGMPDTGVPLPDFAVTPAKQER
jgi:hypothetical protein